MITQAASPQADRLRSDFRWGVFLPPFHPLEEDPAQAFERDFTLLERLDQLDCDEAWIGEHHSGGWEIIGSPEMFIAGAAARTKRIRLGTGVISLPYHNPFMVADRMVQLDYQTRGRAMFGVGPGLLRADASMLGIPADKQRDRMVEAIEIILKLLAGETVTHHSEWIDLEGARLQLSPYTRPRPHLCVASAITPQGGKLAGRLGLGMLCVAASSSAGYDVLDLNWAIAERTAAEHGLQMDRGNLRIMAPVHVAETRQQAIDNLKWGFERWAAYAYNVTTAGPAALGLGPVEQMMAEQKALIGTPDDVIEVLEAYWRKTGGFGCLLHLAQNWADTEATMRSYELFARYVAPRFAGRNRQRQASYDWMGQNVEEFTHASIGAAKKVIDRHFADEEARAHRPAAE